MTSLLLVALLAPVQLESGLGMSGAVWRPVEGYGLAGKLERAGYRPVSAKGCAKGARVAIAHGHGGVDLLQRGCPLEAVALIAVPLGVGGHSRAFAGALMVGAWDARSYRALLSVGLPKDLEQTFIERVRRPFVAPPRDVGPVPRPGPALEALKARPALKVLVIMSAHDGVAPPWTADPAALGLRRENITRVFVDRPNGAAKAWLHLDLVMHPQARTDWEWRLLEWLPPPSPKAPQIP